MILHRLNGNTFVRVAEESTGRPGTFWGFHWRGAKEGWSERWTEFQDDEFHEVTEAKLPART
jgi:hypothetical protein